MFVYSVKASKNVFTAAAAVIVALAATAAVIFCRSGQPAASSRDAVNYGAENASQRAAFLEQFGWKISDEPCEVREILIPSDFENGYTEYADMNKAQGLDLELYKGMRAKRWTYEILNYPGHEGTGDVHANLLVIDGHIVGGDICSTVMNGFIHGFERPASSVKSTESSAAGTETLTAAP